jgi:transcriptional regulator NrdR family protein
MKINVDFSKNKDYISIMICNKCSNKKTRVTNTKPIKGGTVITRYRRCEKCGNRFTSHEYPDREHGNDE